MKCYHVMMDDLEERLLRYEIPRWIKNESIECILNEGCDMYEFETLAFIEDEGLSIEQILKYEKDKEEWESKYGEKEADFDFLA